MLTGDELKEAVRFWALAFLGLGLLTGITNYLQPSMFGISGERLTFRLRKMVFFFIFFFFFPQKIFFFFLFFFFFFFKI